jgi:hypothetical protein
MGGAMLEKFRAVSNPLTIIALFAGLAEIAGTVALATVNKELQPIFVWFVMGFPVLLVVLFFATLNFNPKVLYAPSDFRDEENFLNTLVGTRAVSMRLGEIPQQLEEAKDRILKQAVAEIATAGGAERAKLSEILDRQLEQIESRIKSVQETADAVVSAPSQKFMNLEAVVLRILKNSVTERVAAAEVQKYIAENPSLVQQALVHLVHQGVVLRYGNSTDGYRYQAL